MTLINLVVAALWYLLRDSLPLYARWPLCFAMLAVPYWLLGRGFEAKFTKREYRFAN